MSGPCGEDAVGIPALPPSDRRHAVVLAPYDPAWPGEFRVLGGRLRRSPGSVALRIDPVGSTTVPVPAYVEGLRGALFKGGRTLRSPLAMAENLEALLPDLAVAHDAARFGAEVARRGSSLAASDLLIGALVRHHHGTLVTRDADLAGLPGLPVETY